MAKIKVNIKSKSEGDKSKIVLSEDGSLSGVCDFSSPFMAGRSHIGLFLICRLVVTRKRKSGYD